MSSGTINDAYPNPIRTAPEEYPNVSRSSREENHIKMTFMS
ncbi:hypothetical protein [Saccharicrinis aurantiacus]|nr:hypothetical protein [Saccharicrinis aurantiacus]